MLELNNQIEKHLNEMGLKGILAIYQDVVDKAVKANLRYEEFLALLLEEEFTRKKTESVKAKVAKAKLPFFKPLEEFDFAFQPSLNEKEIIKLGGLDFIDRHENVIFLGSPGVGKTHLAVGLCIKACQAKYKVAFLSAQKMLDELWIAHKQEKLNEKLLTYSRLE